MGPRPCILIVEDNSWVGLDLKMFLEDNGYEVAGPYRSVADTMKHLPDVSVDAAVLDVNLDGEKVFGVVDHLSRMAVPVLFVTGYAKVFMPERYQSHRYLEKPYVPEQLLKAISNMLRLPRVGPGSPEPG